MNKIQFKNYQVSALVKETEDYSVVLAIRNEDKEKCFIKTPKNESGKRAIDREYNNQKFFCELAEKRDCGFCFLPVAMDEGGLVFPDVSEQIIWLGELKSEMKVSSINEPVENYLDSYLKLQRAMREAKFDELPQPIKDDWQMRKNNLQNNLDNNIGYLLENKLVSKSLMDEGLNLFNKYKDNWAFQHHDIVPWHIGRQMDGSLLFVY